MNATIISLSNRQGNHDKQYMVVFFENSAITVWGRRGTNMRIKQVSKAKAVALVEQKMYSRGYSLDSKKLETAKRALQMVQMYAPKYAEQAKAMVA